MVGGDRSESTGNTSGSELVVQHVYGVREGQHGGSAVCIGSLVGRERKQEAARTRNYAGIEEGKVVTTFRFGLVVGRRAQSGSPPRVNQRGEGGEERVPRPLTHPISSIY